MSVDSQVGVTKRSPFDTAQFDIKTRKYKTRPTTKVPTTGQFKPRKYLTRRTTKFFVTNQQAINSFNQRTGSRKYRKRSTTQASQLNNNNNNQTEKIITQRFGQTRVRTGTGRTLPGATKRFIYSRPSLPNNRVRNTVQTSTKNN